MSVSPNIVFSSLQAVEETEELIAGVITGEHVSHVFGREMPVCVYCGLDLRVPETPLHIRGIPSRSQQIRRVRVSTMSAPT